MIDNPIVNILSRLKGVKETANGWQSLCPAHEDRNPSLSITRGDDGRVLLKCFAGCPFDKIMQALGPSQTDKPPKRIVGSYDYRDANGAVLFQVVRYDPKDFRQRRPAGNGGWLWNLQGTPRVLYRLPELLAADPAKPVLVCEGEKDCDNLAALGFIATTNSCGAGKFGKTDSSPLHGRRVVVLPDNDSPGHKHATGVAESLMGVATSVRIVELPGLSQGGDVSDWLDGGATIEQLRQLVEAAPEWHRSCEPLTGNRKPNADHSETAPETAPGGRTYHLTEGGNASRLVDQHGRDLRHCWQTGTWFTWNKSRWLEDHGGERTVGLARDMVRELYLAAARATDADYRKTLSMWACRSDRDTHLRAVVSMARTGDGISVKMDELDADHWLLNVVNGTLDLRTGELRPHNRADLITKLAPVAYDPKATSPQWSKFLDRVLAEDTDLIEFVQQAVGISLTGDTTGQCFFLAVGPGANGKTVFFDTIRGMLGDYAKRISPETFLLQRRAAGGTSEDVANLCGVRMAIAAETGEGRRLAEGLLKDLSGGDSVRARRLYQGSFEFYPQCKLWLGTNHRPRVVGTDHALWRRARLIPFTVVIPTEEQIPDLAEQLKAEWGGILTWAVRGCRQWLDEGKRHAIAKAVHDATQDYRDEQDVVAQFLEECCTLGVDRQESRADLWDAYQTWTTRVNERTPLRRNGFYERLRQRGCRDEKWRKGDGFARGFKGIRINVEV